MPSNLAVCEGDLYRDWLEYASDGTKLGIPAGVPWQDVNRCLQTWYGEYYLPDDLHVRLTSESIDAQFEEDAKTGYDFEEDYWLDEGFLVVNFEISTTSKGMEHLSYDATKSDNTHCDMWKVEESCEGKWGDWLQYFKFNEGDFIMYDLESSMSDDYRSGGTH